MKTVHREIVSLVSHRSTLQFRQCFTLIELLVVIAIIAILAGMLLPSLQKARLMAKTISCTNSIRQTASAIIQYGADNKDLILPSGVSAANNAKKNNRGLHYPSKINDCPWSWYAKAYLGIKDVTIAPNGDYRYTRVPISKNLFYQCAAISTSPEVKDSSGNGLKYHYIGAVSYGMPKYFIGGSDYWVAPQTIIFNRFPSKFGELKDASSRALLMDSVQSSNATKTADGSLSSTQGWYEVLGNTPYISTSRHGGKSNVAFCDGHVKTLGAQEIYGLLALGFAKESLFGRLGYK